MERADYSRGVFHNAFFVSVRLSAITATSKHSLGRNAPFELAVPANCVYSPKAGITKAVSPDVS